MDYTGRGLGLGYRVRVNGRKLTGNKQSGHFIYVYENGLGLGLGLRVRVRVRVRVRMG